MLYNASVYREPSGRVLGVFAAARDITQVKRTQAALRESEERLRAIFDNAPVGISDLSPGGEFVRVNPRFCQITGYTADELRSLRLADITIPTISAPTSRFCGVSSPARSIPIRSRSATCARTVRSSGPR